MVKKIFRKKDHEEIYTKEKCYITEIFNNKGLRNFSMALARVEPRITTEVHRLLETDEAYFILSGKGEIEVDGELMGTVEANDLIFIPKNSTQRIKNTIEIDLQFLCICSPRFEARNYQ
jgi:mannose-6-phosphate isomerase-like protein (cupin superfamily)